MDIQKIRQENIERNRQFEADFLASTSLLGSLASLSEDSVLDINADVYNNSNNNDDTSSNSYSSGSRYSSSVNISGRSRYFAMKQALLNEYNNFIVPAYSDVSSKCKYRESHVFAIFGYLNEKQTIAGVPLLLKGVGSGKTFVLQFVAACIESSCLLITCCGRTSINQFLSLLWVRISKKYSFEIRKKITYNFRNRDLEYFFDKLEGAFDNSNAKIVIFIDNIQELDKMESSFCENLFRVASTRSNLTFEVKIVCVNNECDVNGAWSVMPLDFAEYSESEVKKLIEAAIESDELAPRQLMSELSNNKRGSNSIGSNITTRGETDHSSNKVSSESNSNSNSNSDSNSNKNININSNSSAAVSEDSGFKSLEGSRGYIKSIVNQTLPLVLMKTRHLGEIKLGIVSIVEKVYQVHYNSIKSKMDKSQTQISSGGTNSTQLQVTRLQVASAIKSSMRLPTWRMGVAEGEEPILVTKYISQDTTRQSVEDRRGYIKLDSDTLRASDWCRDIPDISKYIIIAAFIASLNPPDSDIHQIAGLKRQKRRKIAEGREEEDPNAHYASRNTLNVITLERLLGILTTIYSSAARASGISLLGKVDDMSDPRKVIQIVNHTFGDSHLFSAITSLEESGLLNKVSPWSIGQPRYTISITRAMAMEVAASVSFPIMDYLPS